MSSSRYCKFHYLDGESQHWAVLDRKDFASKGARPHFFPDTPLLPKHLRLELQFDWKEERVWGETTHELVVKGRDVKEIRLDAVNLEISRVSVNNRSTGFDNDGERLTIPLAKPLPPGSIARIKIKHSVQRPAAGIYFTQPDENYPNRFKTVWTQGQDEDSRYYFPCLDEPNFKQTTEALLHLPPGMFGLSNGKLLKEKHTASESFYHYKLDLPYSTYLFSIVAGEFSQHVEKWGKVAVKWHVQKGREKEGKNAFKDSARILNFFSDYTGYKYPYEHYTQIAVPDFIFGGMENFTVTTQTDLTLHDDRAHLDGDSNGLVAHEAAHTWFGNLVTAKNWAHAWLHESFATYFDALYTQHSKGEDEFRYQLLEDSETYFGEDARYRRPIVTNIYKEPIDLFDAHLYPGGAVRLHHLKHFVGENEFREALKIFLNRFEFQSVETVDFLRCLEEITGRSFDPWLHQWIYRGGYPVLEIGYQWDSSHNMATVEIKQTQKADKKGEELLFELPLKIAFYNSKNREVFPVGIKSQQEKFSFRLKSKPLYFRLDPDYECPCKKVSLDIPRPMLHEQLKRDEDVVGRIAAADALKKKPSTEEIRLLCRQLKAETFWGVAVRIAGVLGSIGGDLARDGLIRELKSPDAKIRAGIARALGAFIHDEKVARALKKIAGGDPSYRVEAAALNSLGKIKAPGLEKFFEESIQRPTHNGMAAAAVYRAIGELEDETLWTLLLKGADYGAEPNARVFAMNAMACLAKRFLHLKGEALERFFRFAKENRGSSAAVFRGKLGAIHGLQKLDDLSAVPVLRQIAAQETDGRLKRRAEDAISALFSSAKKPQELKSLQTEMDDLLKENKSFRDRLGILEEKDKLKSKKRKTS